MTVAVVVAGRTIVNWTAYSVELDMLTPGDMFDLTIGPVRRDVWDLVAPDTEVQIILRGDQGDSPLITGYVDERNRSGGRSGAGIQIVGRDKVGRFLVDDAADLQTFDDGTALEAIKTIVGTRFDDVVASNARNRGLIVGRRATTVRVSGEPVGISGLGQLSIAQQFLSPGLGLSIIEGSSGKRQGPKKVEPGETKQEVIEHFLEPDRLLMWSSGDGKELIVARPNYDQPSRFRFVAPTRGSERADSANVVDFQYREIVADMHSQVTVVGASPGDAARYAKQVTRHSAIAVDGDGAWGTGNAFQERKLLIHPEHKLRSTAQAADIARHKMALGQAGRIGLELVVRGHHQGLTPDGRPQLFAPDTMAEWVDEEIGVERRMLIVGAAYARSKGERSTHLTLVPEGTELAQ